MMWSYIQKAKIQDYFLQKSQNALNSLSEYKKLDLSLSKTKNEVTYMYILPPVNITLEESNMQRAYDL